MLSLNQSLFFTSVLVGLNFLLSSFELIAIKGKILTHFYDSPLLFARVFFSFLIFINLNAETNFQIIYYLILLIINLYLHYRLKGPFNGGSDYMGNLVLFTLIWVRVFSSNPIFQKMGLYYLSMQLILSYFIPGLLKLKNKKFLNGTAILEIVNSPNFTSPLLFKCICRIKFIPILLGIMIVFLELFFPAVLWFRTPLYFAIGAFLFHIINFQLLGLNRFVLSWLSAYPIFIYSLGHNFSIY